MALSSIVYSDDFIGNKTISSVLNAGMAFIGNRGNANLFSPENSIDALKYCRDTGVDGIFIDIRQTSDKVEVLIKDSTTDRITNNVYTGNVADCQYDDLITAVYSTIFNMALYDKTRVQALPSTLDMFGRKLLIMLYTEIDSNEFGQSLATKINARGLNQFVMFVSTSTNFLTGVKTAVSNAFTVFSSDTATAVNTVVGYGVNAIQVLYSGLTEQNIIDYKTAGLYVGTFGSRSAKVANTFNGYGCNWFITDDPLYCKNKYIGYDTAGQSFEVPRNFKGSGYNDTGNTESAIISTGTRRVGWATTDTDVDSFSAGHKFDGTSVDFSYTTTIYIDSVHADAAARVGLFFNMSDDRMPTVLIGTPTVDGYVLTYAKSGAVKLLKFESGVGISELDTDTWTAFDSTNALTITVTINESGITVAKTGETSLTSEDTDFKEGYMGYFRENHGASFYGFTSAAV